MRQSNVLQLTKLDDLAETNRVLREIQQRINDLAGASGLIELGANTVVRGEMRLQELPQQQPVATDDVQGKLFFQPKINQAPEAQMQVTEDTVVDPVTGQRVHRSLDVVQRAQHDGADLGKASIFNFGVGLDATLDLDNDRIDVVATHEDVVHANNTNVLFWEKPTPAPGQFYGDDSLDFIRPSGLQGPELILTSSLPAFPIFHLNNTDSGSTAAELRYFKNSTTPDINDTLGVISFHGKNSAGTDKTYVSAVARSFAVLVGSEQGLFALDTLDGAQTRNHLYFQGILADVPHLIVDNYNGEKTMEPDQDTDFFLVYDTNGFPNANRKIKPRFLSGNQPFCIGFSAGQYFTIGGQNLTSYDYTFPAGDLLPGDVIVITGAAVLQGTTAGTKTLTMVFGSATPFTVFTTTLTTNNTLFRFQVHATVRSLTSIGAYNRAWWAVSGNPDAGTYNTSAGQTVANLGSNSCLVRMVGTHTGSSTELRMTDYNIVVYRAGGNFSLV